MELVVDHNANALLTVSKTEGTAKSNLFSKVIFCNKSLKLFYYSAGSLNVTTATDTYCYFHKNYLSVFLFCLPNNYLVFAIQIVQKVKFFTIHNIIT